MPTEPSFSLKDQLFNRDKVEYLASLIVQAYPDYRASDYCQEVVQAFPDLELKERIDHMASCLQTFLPNDYLQAIDIILHSLPPELDPQKTDNDFGDFIFAPLALYVAKYGCRSEHLRVSLNALREITKRFSAEDAIRYFINAFPEETLAFLMDCAHNDNYHVRRLASEGTRPKLPWAQGLTIHHTKPLPILEVLYKDNTRYVTRSVANHLNDISKINPPLVVETLNRWQVSHTQSDKEMKFICKHALRTLVKQGNQDALGVLGYDTEPDVTITEFSTSTPQVKIGEAFEFSLTLRSNKKQKLALDYLMLFASANQKSGQKVFKLKQLEMAEGEVIGVRKKHPLRLMTTRRLYPGEHRIILQINGKEHGSLAFDLVES